MSWNNEIKDGERFEFGSNWANFLNNINDSQIESAKKELSDWLGDIRDKTFLDIGSGSGLHSLAARMLGAKVYSFDYDQQSFECTKYLKEKYFKNDKNWTVEQGSVLDKEYLKSLGKFDIVYSWGVLHHTGSMLEALENAQIPVDNGGKLFIAIYNTQVYWTRYWTFVKRTYNNSSFMKYLWIVLYVIFNTTKGAVKDLFLFKNPLKRYLEYKEDRGMSIYYDLIDWLGGYPFETAKPEEIFDFYKNKDFELNKLFTCGGGLGCNQFVFIKND